MRRTIAITLVVATSVSLAGVSASAMEPLAVGSALPAPVPSGPVSDVDDALARAKAGAERLRARADAMRADLSSGSFSRVVARLVSMAHIEATPVAQPTVSALRGLPPGIASPTADLLAAASLAAANMRAAVRADGARSRGIAERADRLGHRMALALARGERLPVEAAVQLKAEATSSHVLRVAAAAGLAIGAAFDRSLEPLRRAASLLRPGSNAAPACDVVDLRPNLCVNGPGSNAIDAEAVLVVDLGGNDTYTSSAGSASSARCVDDPEDTSCTASVLVDVNGNDTYLLGSSISHDHLVGAGSALVGVGVLVDAGGDDAYLANVPERERTLDASFAFGSATLGLGLLADLTGNDRYELTGRVDDVYNPYTHGAALDGMGALLDLDGANTYRVALQGPQTPNPENPLIVNDFANSMAVGIFGAGALVDRTGYATFETSIEATAGEQKDLNLVNPITQGVGLVGDAAMFVGAGPTTYAAIGRRVASASLAGQTAEPEPDEEGNVLPIARIPGGAYVTAQAVGALGFGVIADAGGDDTYSTLASSEHHLLVTAENGCSCDRAIASLDVTGWSDFFGGPADEAGAGVSTQGVGSGIFVPDAGALLHDRGGDDLYSGRSEVLISARAENRLTGHSAGARAEAVPSRVPTLSAFGQGLGSDIAPTALLDEAGDDSYALVSEARTDAAAEAAEGPATARALGSTTATHGQGASYWDPAEGFLVDLGGRDAYEAHAISRTTTAPTPGAWDVERVIGAQGAVGGVLADVDDNLNDSFTATPELGPGVGMRGEGPGWVDVSKTFPGYGVAPLQPAKRDVVLTMDQENPPSASSGVVPFRARVTDGGAPVPGREVTFDLEWRSQAPTGERWNPHRFRAHGVTDQDGWAVGHLDLEEFVAYWGGGAGDLTLRITARFHGDLARRPATAIQPFTIH